MSLELIGLRIIGDQPRLGVPCTLCLLFLLEATPTFRASHVNPARG
jgi:hypothetical protein